MRPGARQLPLLGLAVGGLVVLVLILSGGSSYSVRVLLANADGLRAGSQVKVGGVPVGTVSSLRLGRSDVAEAGLQLNHGYAVSGDARAAIVPSDLLGSMYVQLTPGTGARLPSGATIPAARVTYPVQLDQVLNVLDATTRARLGILIDEAGTALTGRGLDFNRLLALLPQDFGDGSRMLGQLVSDNHTLAALIDHSDGFISTLVPNTGRLTALIQAAARTMTTAAARQADLRQIFALAPATLTTARRFLAELRATALPLKPAAEAITAAAPRLTATLDQLPAFQQAADPALDTATEAAPLLTRLGVQATPVIDAAKPTAGELERFAQSSGPVSYAAGASIDNALGLVEGWARSIQTSDDIGHVFHGRALVGAEFLRSLLGSATATPGAQRVARRAPAHGAPAASATPSSGGQSSTAASPPAATPGRGLTGAVGSLLSGIGKTVGVGAPGGGPLGSKLSALLGYLLKP